MRVEVGVRSKQLLPASKKHTCLEKGIENLVVEKRKKMETPHEHSRSRNPPSHDPNKSFSQRGFDTILEWYRKETNKDIEAPR